MVPEPIGQVKDRAIAGRGKARPAASEETIGMIAPWREHRCCTKSGNVSFQSGACVRQRPGLIIKWYRSLQTGDFIEAMVAPLRGSSRGVGLFSCAGRTASRPGPGRRSALMMSNPDQVVIMAQWNPCLCGPRETYITATSRRCKAREIRLRMPLLISPDCSSALSTARRRTGDVRGSSGPSRMFGPSPIATTIDQSNNENEASPFSRRGSS